jgi:phosphatidylserine/phosphatidylglycerophosphate/cardiolipin synthase-like enzyme
MRSYVDRQAGNYIHTKLKNAKDYAYICSPYIDRRYLNEIIALANKIPVKLITTDRQKGFYLKSYLTSNLTQPNHLQSLISKNSDIIHAKIYVIDDKYAVDGSANLTDNGLWHQVNYLHQYDKPEEVAEIKKVFERIWDFNYEGNP